MVDPERSLPWIAIRIMRRFVPAVAVYALIDRLDSAINTSPKMFSMEWEQFAAHNFNELPYLIVVTSHRKQLSPH